MWMSQIKENIYVSHILLFYRDLTSKTVHKSLHLLKIPVFITWYVVKSLQHKDEWRIFEIKII